MRDTDTNVNKKEFILKIILLTKITYSMIRAYAHFFGIIILNKILKKIKSAISESFGIRCPPSIQSKTADVFDVFDFENDCAEWSTLPINETAFCGKCSRKNQNSFLYNVNSPLSFKYVNII